MHALFIRGRDGQDHFTLHDTRAKSHLELAAHARLNWPAKDLPDRPASDADVVHAYFDDDIAFYAIATVDIVKE